MKDCRMQIRNEYLIYFIYFLFLFNFLPQHLLSQQLLNPTFTNYNVESKRKINFMGSMGETFVSTKYLKNYVIVEGFYGYDTFKFDTIGYRPTKCKIFPNPAHGKFTILNESNNFKIKIDIFNLSGALVRTLSIPSNSLVHVNDLQTGIYILKIFENNEFNIKQSIYKLIIYN